MGIFHCYVSLPEDTFLETNGFSHLKMDPQGSWLTLSDDEQGVYNHLRNARYLGSMKPFSEGEPGCLGDGWKIHFLLARYIFRGKLLISGSVPSLKL